MTTEIREMLTELEQEKEITILFAVEAGSRAWGFESHDSDWDVRFVYLKPTASYLTLDNQKDTIERMYGDIDIIGWDIKKALTLFRKSNPNFIEWLHSPITYIETFHNEINLRKTLAWQFLPESISKRTMIHHYYGMAMRNWKEYLQEEPVWTKKYLYVVRPLLACTWIESEGTTPPIKFRELVSECYPLLKEKTFEHTNAAEITRSIRELIQRKIAGDELSTGPRIEPIHHFIEQSIPYFQALGKTIDPNMPQEHFIEFTKQLTKLYYNLLSFHTNDSPMFKQRPR